MNKLNDYGLTAAQLDAKYQLCGEHPIYGHREWRFAVASQTTENGYWEWVEIQLREDQLESQE